MRAVHDEREPLIPTRARRSAARAPWLLFVAAMAPLPAQSAPRPCFANLSVPAGVNANAVSGQGKLVLYDDGSSLHIYSAATRRWHQTSRPTGTAPKLFNDILFYVEPTHVRAFSALTGAFADIATTTTATVLNPASHKNDSILLIHDGGCLHAFSAFTGQWSSRQVGAGFTAAVERHVALVQDGATLLGLSAFGGGFVAQAANAAANWIDADGSAAFAVVGGDALAFSAHTRSFQSRPLPNAATFTRGDDWGLWRANDAVLAYSGLRGKFQSRAITTGSLQASTDLFALLGTPTGYLAFSATTADLLEIPRRAQTVVASGATALLIDPQVLRGYSALRQATASAPFAAVAYDAAGEVAYARDTSGATLAWSSETGRFHVAPSGTTTQPALTTTTIGLQTSNETFAFDARSGVFVPRGGACLALVSNPSSAPLLGYDATTFWAFDCNTASWLGTPRLTTAAPLFRAWRTSALVIEADRAHAVGAQSGRWEHTTLPPSSLSSAGAFANSEVGYVVTVTDVTAASMLGEVVPWQQFPQFRRVQPVGGAVTCTAQLASNALGVLAIGIPMTPTQLPGFGMLALDPGQAAWAMVAGNGAQPAASWQLQAAPGLVGATLAVQLLVLPSNGAPRLSAPAFVRVW